MNIWFVADTHFGHGNIIEYEKRPYSTVEEMNEDMIKKWNSVVKEEDIVYHLGDVAICKSKEIEELLSRLNGIKKLVRGNHDLSNSVTKWKRMGFEDVLTTTKDFYTGVEMEHDGEKFIISHGPIENLALPNVHGHVHSNIHHLNQTTHKCVSVELIDYTPIHINEIIKWIKTNKNQSL